MMDLTKIPKDWTVKRIGKITKTLAGGTPSTSNAEYWNGDIKWMSSGDLNLKIVYEVEGRITELGLKSSSTRLIPPKSILIGLAGQGKTRGTVAMNMIELCTNQSVAAILPSNEFFEDYLYHNLDFRYEELRQLSTGDGGRGGLNLNIINSVQIPLPPLTEQKAIAQVLSTADAAIHTTEKLIAQKELRKKWLMRQLLTGKKRLKGFGGEVKLKLVQPYLIEISERNKDLKITNVLSVTNSRGFINQADQFNRVVASEDATNYKIVRKGQFAYNPSRVNVGSLDLLTDFESGILSPMYVVFETAKSQLLPDYFYYQLKTQWFYGHISMFVQGSVRDSLSFDGLCSMKFFIPSIEEQTAIAQVLQTADKEISLLKAKAKKLKEQKKGLMQVLLTGKVRLKIKNDN